MVDRSIDMGEGLAKTAFWAERQKESHTLLQSHGSSTPSGMQSRTSPSNANLRGKFLEALGVPERACAGASRIIVLDAANR
jgi:hypothetical protein